MPPIIKVMATWRVNGLMDNAVATSRLYAGAGCRLGHWQAIATTCEGVVAG